MKVLTKYEMLETREMNDVEIYGAEIMLVEYLRDIGYIVEREQLGSVYQGGCLQLIDGIGIPEGVLERIGMVHNRLVAEVCLTDEHGEETEESVLFWFNRFGLGQIEG